TSVCPRDRGLMSRKAKTRSSSYTLWQGISPAMMRWKMVMGEGSKVQRQGGRGAASATDDAVMNRDKTRGWSPQYTVAMTATPSPAAHAGSLGPAPLRACPRCGLVCEVPPIPLGAMARCPRCHATVLRDRHPRRLSRAAAFALAALILYPLAMALPIMEI